MVFQISNGLFLILNHRSLPKGYGTFVKSGDVWPVDVLTVHNCKRYLRAVYQVVHLVAFYGAVKIDVTVLIKIVYRHSVGIYVFRYTEIPFVKFFLWLL